MPSEQVMSRLIAADSEMRRGMLAMNGAGLVAIVGLLSTKLSGVAARGSAWAFATGLCLAVTTYVFAEAANSLALEIHSRLDELERSFGGDTQRPAALLSDNARMVRRLRKSVHVITGLIFFTMLASFIAFLRGCWVVLAALP